MTELHRQNNVTLVLVTHDHALASKAQRQIILRDGSVLSDSVHRGEARSFLFNLTRREIRSSWRRLLFFFLCIALGVGSVVALRSLIQNLTKAVATDARALMTADIDINSTNDFTPVEIQKIEEVIGRSNDVEARNETITTAQMVRPSDPKNESVKFVELKGIEPPFPLVGTFTLSDGKPFDFWLLKDNGAVIAQFLLEELKVKIGDKLKIGAQRPGRPVRSGR